ncbi:hypothetical protein PBOI14_28710 [Pseudomonas sp. Boi14]|nr:hypothetical protein PBOI14_28710 [Pseudomonas sp. Boi14]
MSEKIRINIKDRAVYTPIAPNFPLDRCLPTTPKLLSENIRRQKFDEFAFGEQQRKIVQARGDVYSGTPCCKTLHITLTFDGTNNNNEADSASSPSSCSNMARLYHASLGLDDTARQNGYFSYYSPGVGTVFPDIKEMVPNNWGLIAASGGENRINWGLTRMIAALKDSIPEQNSLSLDDTQALVEGMATCWYGNVATLGLLENGEKKREAAMRPYMNDLKKLLDQRREVGEKPISWPCAYMSMASPEALHKPEPLPIGCKP